MDNIMPIEYNHIRVLTTQQLAEAYEVEPRKITDNFNNNKSRYTEGKHYICLEGEDLKRFKSETENFGLVSPNARTFYLWLEKGCFLAAKSLNTDKAWEAYDRLVDGYFALKKQSFDRSALSPELQMFYSIADAQAKHELEIKRQGEQIAKVEQKVDAIQEIMVTPIGDWKADINKRVREISIKSDTDYQTVWGQLYGELETTAHCSLNRLCNNKRARMEKAGNTKAAIKDGTTKIAIIYDKPQLKAIFESIVKNHAMRYV